MRGLCGRFIVGVSLSGACATAAVPTYAQDPLTRLQLMGAAFADAPAAARPGRAIASAFLPGRGVVTWDITGLSPEQAKEAQIEAMGLADARAVQREIDDKTEAAKARAAARPSGAAALAEARPAPGASFRVRPEVRSKGGFDAEALGVKRGEGLKTRPRLYAFAAASGTGVGLNMTHDESGWKNAGLTSDRGGFVGQRQAGLAWRMGRAQTALSYQQVKSRGDLVGMASDKDHRVMLTTTLPTESLSRLFAKRD